MDNSRTAPAGGDRLAKVMARSGLCSRRDAEEWIKAGRVVVNGKKVLTPAFNVTDTDHVVVDGVPLAARQGTRVWLYHKPAGLVVTEKDPEGRPTVFETLEAQGLPRVLSIGRLDINTEGLLLLTNDGGLKRVLELPVTGWLRKYRVRAHGTVTQAQLDTLKSGIEIEGVKYGPIEATLERDQGSNVWLQLALREGKNREVKNVLAALGLMVNRLIRISFGPFQLGDLPIGGIETVKARVLKDQLGKRLAEEAEVDFDSEMPERDMTAPKRGAAAPADERTYGRGVHTVAIAQQRFRFTDRAEPTKEELAEKAPRPSRPGRDTGDRPRRPSAKPFEADDAPPRHVHFDDGREPAVFEQKSYGKKGKPGADGERPKARGGKSDPPRAARSFGDKPRAARPDGDRPRAPRAFGDKPPRGAGAGRSDGDRARPARSFGDKPSTGRGDKPYAPRGDKPYAPRGDKPYAPRGDKPYAPRGAGAAVRPPRGTDDRPRTPRPDGDRPGRNFSEKPRSAGGAGDRPRSAPGAFRGKPRAAAADGDRPARSGFSKPRGADGGKPARSFDGKPRTARPTGGAPRSPRPAGSGARPPRKDGPPRGPSRPRSK